MFGILVIIMRYDPLLQLHVSQILLSLDIQKVKEAI